MRRRHEESPAVAGPAAPRVQQVQATAPASPVPLPAQRLVVGPAGDQAEHAAEASARAALARVPDVDDGSRPSRPSAPSGGSRSVSRAGGALGPGAAADLDRLRGTGRPLEGATGQRMRRAFGTSFSRVRLHDDDASAQLARSLGARAFTSGQDVFLGSGEHAPGTATGDRVLAHELAHTLQPAGPVRRLPGDDGLEEPDVRKSGTAKPQVAWRPKTMDELLGVTDSAAERLIRDTSATSPLLDVLLGAFEGDWFKAKDCLVFGRWPTGKPAFGKEMSLALMRALTAVRASVHEKLQPIVHAELPKEMTRRAGTLRSNPRLAGALRTQTALTGEKQLKHMAPTGAQTVTSDIDVSSGGANTEIAIKVYNEQFRKLLGTALDPGTVFDLNVYAKDFIFGAKKSADNTVVTPNKEHEVQPDAADQAAADEEQEIYSLVHLARFMPDDRDWSAHVEETLAGIPDSKRRARQARLFRTARARQAGFELMLQSTMDQLRKTVDTSLKSLEESSWAPKDQKHFAEGALRMRAANQMYENKLIQVKEMRAQIEELQALDPVPLPQVKSLVAALTKAISVASLYANEVYGSGGATVHAVIGMQTGGKMREENIRDKRERVDVSLVITPEQWHHAVTDNLGDVLKDFQHYGHKHGTHEPDHKYAAFKMGKYVDRMINAVKNLGPAGAISPQDAARLAARFLDPQDPAAQLAELAHEHVKAKADIAKDDPSRLVESEYFRRVDAAKVKAVAGWAAQLGSEVRAMIANHKPVPVQEPEPDPVGPAVARRVGKLSPELGAALEGLRWADRRIPDEVTAT